MPGGSHSEEECERMPGELMRACFFLEQYRKGSKRMREYVHNYKYIFYCACVNNIVNYDRERDGLQKK